MKVSEESRDRSRNDVGLPASAEHATARVSCKASREQLQYVQSILA